MSPSAGLAVSPAKYGTPFTKKRVTIKLLSTSESLFKTPLAVLTVKFTSSVVEFASFCAIGLSFTETTVSVNVAVSVPPLPSEII